MKKFKIEYKDFPDWNKTIEAESWTDLMPKIGSFATKIEIVDDDDISDDDDIFNTFMGKKIWNK